jgi:hypothetical protein
MFFDKVAFVSALQKNNPSTDKESFVTYSGFQFGGVQSAAVKVNIQPASPELTAISEGEVFKTFKAFTNASGVTDGMLLTLSGTGTIYRVRGREAFDYMAGRHYELTLIKSDINP